MGEDPELIALTLLSLVFCKASFKRLDRFELLFSWEVDPRPDRDTAVETEPWTDEISKVLHGRLDSLDRYLMLRLIAATAARLIPVFHRKVLEASLQCLGSHGRCEVKKKIVIVNRKGE